jgi:RNA polymerase primary sigma factor
MDMFNGNYLTTAQEEPANRGKQNSTPRVTKATRRGGFQSATIPLTGLPATSSVMGLGRRRAHSGLNPIPIQPAETPEAFSPPTRPATARKEISSTGAPAEMDSILSQYMREAGEVTLLTPQQELELAARIQQGDAAAREHMIRANLRFVIKIAREYEHLGMPLLDLINEGNIGLMKAVEKFDPTKGAKLATYSALWIKQQIRRALASQGKTIRLPVHVADKIYQLGKAEVRLRALLGREATDEELAAELEIKPSRVATLRRAALRPSSLDALLGDEKSSTIAEVVADENAASPFDQLREKTETVLIHQLVKQLPEREARIIRFRFGLDRGGERTLEDVGRKFKLTRERIRQLQNLALAKLRKMLEDPDAMPVAA